MLLKYFPDQTCLKPLIEHHDWQKMGHTIAGMQQMHKLPGISKRRRMEEGLILTSC